MTARKPAKRKPVVRRRAAEGMSPNMVNQHVSAAIKALDAMGQTTPPYERARADYIASHPVQPTQWERLSAWVKDNPIDAGLIAVGFGGAVVLGVMAAL